MELGESENAVIQRALAHLLSNAGFSRNERQSKFLRFLVERHLEGREGELKESVIGVEVFDRKPDYDPKLDAIVRTEAVRLRSRLSRYYADEGREAPVVIELPKGGYRLVFRHRAAVPDVHERPARGTWWAVAAVVALSISLAGTGWWWTRASRTSYAVAVLPLENLGPDPANDYFADGLTDEIVRDLSTIEGLTVRSRTSSFSLRDKQLTAAQVGRQLDVEYLLEGSVLHAGERLRVDAQLIRVRDDFPVWSGRFDRELTDVFAIQDEISRGIVNGLRLKLGQGRRRYETSVEAHDLYLRGRYAMKDFPDVAGARAREAVQYFEQAIAKDRSYALAYAGLADTFLAIHGNMVKPDALPRARAAAKKAVELDPLLSEAHSAWASVRAREYAWQEAEQGFRRAIELNPNNALAHLDLGFSVLVMHGRFDEGLREVRQAAQLDPLSPYTRTEFARALLLAGTYRESIEQARKAIELAPERNRPYMVLRRALYMNGDVTEALTVPQKGLVVGAQVWPACAYFRAGRREEAFEILQKLAATPPPHVGSLVAVHACAGEKEQAIRYLQQQFAMNQSGLADSLQAPELAWMRSDPRITQLRKQIDLAP